MALWSKLTFWRKPPLPAHLERGALGEQAARRFLQRKGLKFLAANFAGRRGEIDLIFRDGTTLVFVEVKTRSSTAWTRPSRAVNAEKRRALIRTAQEYLRLLDHPQAPFRFDVVEVLMDGDEIGEIRHIENSFHSARGR